MEIPVNSLLQITKPHIVFEVFDSENSATHSFAWVVEPASLQPDEEAGNPR